MAGEGRFNRSGLPMFHLRRIGPPATKHGVADIMDFFEVTTMIGKSAQSHYVIDSASDMRRLYISRNHARVVTRTPSNDHKLFDDSMNGMFINNLKIVHSVVLSEGDRVTFGHPQGAKVPGGVRKLQPDSEYQFLFEKCNCAGQMIVSNRPSGSGCNFVVPEVPVHAGRSSSKKRDRNTTQTLTTEDVRKLKEEFQQQSCSPVLAAPSQPSSCTLAKSEDQSDCPSPLAEDNSTPSVSSNESQQNSNGDALHTNLAEDSSTVATEEIGTETSETTAAIVNPMDGPQNRDDAEDSSSVATSETNTETSSTTSFTTPSVSHKESLPNPDDALDACPAEDSSTAATEGMSTEISARAISISHMEDPQNHDDDAPQTCPAEGSYSVASEEMATETRATTEQKTVSELLVEQDEGDNTSSAEREIFLQQEEEQIDANPSDKDSGPCAECPRNSGNLSREDSLEPPVIDPGRNSVDSASLSKKDSFDLVVNLPNNDIPLCRETHTHICPSPFKTSTPKPKKTVLNRQVPMKNDTHVYQEKKSSQTSAMLENVAQAVPLEKVLQMDAAIQTSPLVPLVEELSYTDTQQRRQGSADPVQYEEEDPIMYHQEGNTGLEMCDHEPELEGDPDIKSCASQSTDSAECPTEIIVPDSIDYSGMFEDSDMDDDFSDDSISASVGDNLNETIEDLSKSRTEGNTKEVYMDTSDVANKTEHVPDDVNKTALVMNDLDETEPFSDELDKTEIVSNRNNEELLNKTYDMSCSDVEMEDEVQFDKTENVSESLVFTTEVDQTKNLTGSDCDLKVPQLDKTENISEDNVNDDDDIEKTVVEVNRSVTPDKDTSEIKEKDTDVLCEDGEVETDVINHTSTLSEQKNTDKAFKDEVADLEKQQLGMSTVEQDCSKSVDVVMEHIDDIDGKTKLNEGDEFEDPFAPIQPAELIKNETDKPSGDDVNPSEDDVNPSENNVNSSEDDVNLNEDVNPSEDDVNLNEDDVNPNEDDVNPSENNVNPYVADIDLDQKPYHNFKILKDMSKNMSSNQNNSDLCNIVVDTHVEHEDSTSTDHENHAIDRDTARTIIPMDMDTLNNDNSDRADLDKSERKTLNRSRVEVNQDDNSTSENIQQQEEPGDVTLYPGCTQMEMARDNLSNNFSIRADEVDGNVVLEIHEGNISCAVDTVKDDMFTPSQPVESLDPNSTEHAVTSMDQEERNGSIVLTEKSVAHAQIGNSDNQAVQEIKQLLISCDDSLQKVSGYENPSVVASSSKNPVVGDTDTETWEQQEATWSKVKSSEKDGDNKQCFIEDGNYIDAGKREDILDKETIECSMDLSPSATGSVSGLSTVPATAGSISGLSTVPATAESVSGLPTVRATAGSVSGLSTVRATAGSVSALSTVPATAGSVSGLPTVRATAGSVSGLPTVRATAGRVSGLSTVRATAGSVSGLSTVPHYASSSDHDYVSVKKLTQNSQGYFKVVSVQGCCDGSLVQQAEETDDEKSVNREQIQQSVCQTSTSDSEELKESCDIRKQYDVNVLSSNPDKNCLEEHQDMQAENVVSEPQTSVRNYLPPKILDDSPSEWNIEAKKNEMTSAEQILESSPADRSMKPETDGITPMEEVDGTTPTEEIFEAFPTEGSMETGTGIVTLAEQKVESYPTDGNVQAKTDCMTPEEQILECSPTEGSVEAETDCMTPEEQILECSPTEGSVETETDCMTPEEHKGFQTDGNVHTDTECTTSSNHILGESLTDGSMEAITPEEQSLEGSRTGGSMETEVDSMTPKETVLELEAFPTDGIMEAKMDGTNHEEQILEGCPAEGSEETEADAMTTVEKILEASITDGSMETEVDDTIQTEKILSSNGIKEANTGIMVQAEPKMEDFLTDGNMQAKTDCMTPEKQIQDDSLTEGSVETKSDCITPTEHVLEGSPIGESMETESDGMTHTEETLVGFPGVERMKAERDGRNPSVQIQEGFMTKWRMEPKMDNITALEQELKNSPTKESVEAETDNESDICDVSKPCSAGSTSPISKNIWALQDFGKSISPLAKTTENSSGEEVFMSPASKRRRDRDDASDMISCLEDSMISVDNISDLQDVSMSTQEIKDIPPVFILDKQFLEENYDGEDQTNSSKSILMDNCDREDQKVTSSTLITGQVVTETSVSDTTQTKDHVEKLTTNEKCILQEKGSCELSTKNDLVNQESIVNVHENRDNMLKEMTSGRSSTDNDQFVANEGSGTEEKLSNKDKSADVTGMDIESTSEGNVKTENCVTSEGSCADSHQESSLEFSSLPQTDSYTSQFSESDLVCQWEVDNRKLNSASSIEGNTVGDPMDELCPADVYVCATADVTATVSTNGSAVISGVSTEVSAVVSEYVSAILSTDVPNVSAVVSTNRSAIVSTDLSAVVSTDTSAVVSEDVRVSEDVSTGATAGVKTHVEEAVQNVDTRSPEVTAKEEDLVDEAKEIQPSGQESLCPDTNKQCADVVMKKPCCESIETLEHDTQMDIKDSCSVKTIEETDQPLVKYYSSKLAPKKRKRTFSDSTSDDESNTGKKKRTAWYQNVKTTVSNFFNIRHKVLSTKKSACTKRKLKKENIAKIVKHFFSYKKKHAESQRISADRTDDSHTISVDAYSDTGNIEGEADMECQITSKERENIDNASVQNTCEHFSESSNCVSGTNSVLTSTESSEQISARPKDKESDTGCEELKEVSACLTDLAHKVESEEFKVLSPQSSQDESFKILDENVNEMMTDSDGLHDGLKHEEAPVVVDDCHIGNLCMSTEGSHIGATETLQASSADMEIESEEKIQSEASEPSNPENSSSHGGVDDHMSNDSDVSGQSQGFSPCLSSESRDEGSNHPENFDTQTTQTSVDDNKNMETDVQKYMEADACDITSNENILARCQEKDENRNIDFTLEKLSACSEGSDLSFADSQVENSESLLAPVEALAYSTNQTQACGDTEEDHASNDSDSESLLAPVPPEKMESSTECERKLTSASNQERRMSELSTNTENDDTHQYWDNHAGSTSDSDSLVASVVHTGLKSPVKAVGSYMKTESQTLAGKSLLSSIPMLDPEGKTYSLSDMDSSDISIITLRSSEELECWGGNDSTEDDVKGRSNVLDKKQNVGPKNKFTFIKDELVESPIPVSAEFGRDRQFMSKLSADKINSPEICGNNSELSPDYTPPDEITSDQMDSMVTVNNSEQNTEYTDVSSINYCPLPDFETDSSIEITASVVERVPLYVASSKTEIVISDSSDELPEVMFLREERKKTNVHVKFEFTDEVIVKQEIVSRGCDSTGSTTKDMDMGSKPVVQAGLDSPLQTQKTTSYLPGRVLNSPMSELSTNTPLSSLEDQPVDKKKNSPRKRTKKRSPVKCKVEMPEKKQNTPSKYKRRPRRKKNKSGNLKCCYDDIELITDSDSDDDGPSNSKFSSPMKSAQKRSMLNQIETRLVGLSPAQSSSKSNDLQDDLGIDLVDDLQVGHQNDTGRESSVQDIFNSEEFCEDSSLPPSSFSEEVFGTNKALDAAATEESSPSIEGDDLHTAIEGDDMHTAIEGDDLHTAIEKDKELESDNTTLIKDSKTSQAPADDSDEFSCQGDPTIGDCLEESMDDNDSVPSSISPPPQSPDDGDDDVIPNTCDEDDDMDMNIHVLPPPSPSEPLGDVTPSQCLSPVFPDVTKTFDIQARTGEGSVEGASKMFDSDEEFSIPVMDWGAFEDSDEKMNEESKSSMEDVDDHEIQDVEDNRNDDASPTISPGHNCRDHFSDSEETDNRSITTTPRPDDFTMPSTSTSFKRPALFNEDDGEMDEAPSPKRARTKCTSRMAFKKISPASKLKKAFDEDMLISTQCPLVTDMSESEFDNASRKLFSVKNTEGSAKKRKAKEFLVNVQAKLKKYKTKKKATPVQSESVSSSQETPGEIPVASSVQRRIHTEAEVSNGRIADYLTRCKDVISKLHLALNGPRLSTFPRVSQWRKDLSEVEDKTLLPKTTIAVVGDTGSGKSSLMNAVIDQHNTLPTSGMRACTAVVVEVLANTTSSNFEADITFLSHKEWFDELQLLISDLTTADGKLKKSVPDQDSEAGVAFLKVKAVYGKVDTMAALSRLTAVTRMLDNVKTIRATDPKFFRQLIDRYIETADPGAGGQFWPIVKQVTIRMPNCDACSSGAVLVDLPGVRDSNAARDQIARNYLKNCTVVWVVAAIHRAINNKTAKDMLGENFRRQLLMDGQYGSVAFICTKSDDIMPSEIMRNLNLHDACESSETEIQSLLEEKEEADRTIRNLKKEIRGIGKDIKELTSDIADMKETIEETTTALDGDVIDLDGEGADGMESLKELRLVVLEKEESLRTLQGEKADKEKGMDKATRQSLENDKKIELKRKEISAFCAKARNDYSKSQIKRDFKAGLREMKRKAGLTNEDDEMEDEDQDYNSDDDDEEIGQTAENLKVFCVSSMEYQKMKNLLTNDGPPNVFSSTEETQIPVLRRYIHELTSVRRQQHVDRLIRTLGQFVFDIQSYIMADGTTCKGTRRDAKSAVEENSKELQEKFEPVLARLSHEIEQTFFNSIETKMADGTASAMSSANDTASKWGAKQNKEVKADGGLHWKTYQCAVRRQGVYNSKTFGNIDFNEQLSEPMYRCISVCWDKVFSGLLWKALEDCKSLLLMTLTVFVRDLCDKLNNLEVPRNQTDRASTQLCHSTKDKLAEMLTNLKELVLSRQRDISRVITPTVKDNLDHIYNYCGGEAGSGMFMRMKQAMEEGVDYKRRSMFDQASHLLLQELEELKVEIVSHVRSVCVSLCLMLQAAFEPLWEAPSQTKLLKDILFESVTDAVLSVTGLHTDANLSLPVAPARDSSPDQDSPTPADQILSDSANQDPNVNVSFPGPSGLQVANTTPVGPQMYTMTYGMTQKLVTDAHGKAQHVSMETSKSAQVTDVLKHLKQEPGSTKLLSNTSVKKEREASSNFAEVSGPELRWLQNTLPNLDQYTENVSSVGQSNSGPIRMNSSDISQPQHGIQPVRSPRSGLSPRVSSTITQPQSGLFYRVSSAINHLAGSSQSGGTPRSGFSPRVSSAINHPAGSSQSVETLRSRLSPRVSSIITQSKEGTQSGLSSQILSSLAQSQSVKNPRYSDHSDTTQVVTAPPDRIVKRNSSTTTGVHQSADGTARRQGTMGLGDILYSTVTNHLTDMLVPSAQNCKSASTSQPANSVREQTVSAMNSLLQKGISITNLSGVATSGSALGASRSQGNQQTMPKAGNFSLQPGGCKNVQPQPGIKRGNIPPLSPRNSQNQQATNIPTAVQVGKNILSALSSSNACKTLVSIVNKRLVTQLQTKHQQSSSTSSSNSFSASPSTSDRSPTFTNCPPVTGTSSSNRGRLRLSLRKTSAPESPLNSCTRIKQEPVERDTGQQRRVRRANNSSLGLINLCDSSDSEN
ncbi:uncharacterized protein LOC110460370 isoform X2 [Mizuhopecten yessoensis]|uniref:uncharacterized protein LOC110460370 isoform X2 n=1 Tax=Mizuhopecten yessoensis TaxID=6573 RepID=UPI000B45DBEC|nr:uncharacterized protein LOC110460370 isoform X2 [Mizuhopecten yessoensis]